MSICIFLLIFKSGINITKLLSAKKKLEAKRKRHEKKMAKRRQQVRVCRDTATKVTLSDLFFLWTLPHSSF